MATKMKKKETTAWYTFMQLYSYFTNITDKTWNEKKHGCQNIVNVLVQAVSQKPIVYLNETLWSLYLQ